jgi:hypothetical protein
MADDRTYVRLHDGFFRNPKARAVGKTGRELYLAGLCYCGHELTDGRIPKTMLPVIAAEAEVGLPVAKQLVQIGLWRDEGDYYVIHDYGEHQRSAADVEELKRKRQEAGSKGGRAKANGLASATANGKHPPSKPLPESESESESESDLLVKSSSEERLGVPASDDDRLTNLWKAWAHRQLHKRRADGLTDPGNMGGWLRTVAQGLADQYEPDARALLAELPTADANELLERLTAPAPKPERLRCPDCTTELPSRFCGAMDRDTIDHCERIIRGVA